MIPKQLEIKAWKRYALFVSVMALIMGGCATTYKKQKSGGGYSDYRITTNVFSVSFRGNPATQEEDVEKFLLRRACDLTLEHGYKYFVVIAEKGRTRSGSVGYSGVKIPVVTPGETIHIKCYHEPLETEVLIDAAEFLRFNFAEEYDSLPEAETISTP